MKKGYIVVETAEDFEQVLCLEKDDKYPDEGILGWQDNGFNRHVFANRKLAREAINRTHHFSLAFGYKNMPEKQHCKIHAVELPEI